MSDKKKHKIARKCGKIAHFEEKLDLLKIGKFGVRTRITYKNPEITEKYAKNSIFRGKTDLPRNPPKSANSSKKCSKIARNRRFLGKNILRRKPSPA